MVSLYVIYTALHLELSEEEQALLFLSVVVVVVDVAIFVEFLRIKFLVCLFFCNVFTAFCFKSKTKVQSSIYCLLFGDKMQFLTANKQSIFWFAWLLLNKFISWPYIWIFFFWYLHCKRRSVPTFTALTLTTVISAFCSVHHFTICILLMFFMRPLEITKIL